MQTRPLVRKKKLWLGQLREQVWLNFYMGFQGVYDYYKQQHMTAEAIAMISLPATTL